MKFSQRIGKTEIRTILQKDSIDDELKTKIWNSFYNDIVYHIRRNNTEILLVSNLVKTMHFSASRFSF